MLKSLLLHPRQSYFGPQFFIAAIPNGMLECRKPFVLENMSTRVFLLWVFALIRKMQKATTTICNARFNDGLIFIVHNFNKRLESQKD